MNPRTLVPLSNLITLQRGFDLPEAARKVGDVPVVASTAIAGYHNETRVSAPGVVIGRSGSIGGGQYITQDFWPLNTTLWVKDFKGHYPRFIYYLLRSIDFSRFNAGAGVPTLNRNHLDSLQVPSFDARTEECIAQALAAYDDLIENNCRRIALLEQSARLLYREWFVHLRFPGHEHVKVMGGVPEGWERRSLGELYENLDRVRVPLSVLEREKRAGEYPYYGAASVLDYIDGFLFDGRFLLMGEDGSVITPRGTPMLQLVQGKFWVNNHAHVLKGGVASVEFLYCALSEYQIQGHVTGVAQPKITQSSMNRIPVLLPTEALRREFQEFVQCTFDQRFNLEAMNGKLRQARDLLLPRLMSGDLVV